MSDSSDTVLSCLPLLAGDSDFLSGQLVTRRSVELLNEQLKAEGKRQAEWEYALLGITKASINSESFLSAASFQETTRVLTDASLKGKVDYLRGLKENIIIGKLIPAGTGMKAYRKTDIYYDGIEDDDERISGLNANNGDIENEEAVVAEVEEYAEISEETEEAFAHEAAIGEDIEDFEIEE